MWKAFFLALGFAALALPAWAERLEMVTSVPLVKARQVDFQGDFAWVAQNMDGAALVNIADPTAPKVVRKFAATDMMPMMFRVLPEANLLLSADRFLGLAIYDVSVPDSPTTLSLTPLPGGMTTHMDVTETTDGLRLAILARAGEGIISVDITDPAQPKIIDRFQLGIEFSREVATADGIVYIADSAEGGLKAVRLVPPGKFEPLYVTNLFGSCETLLVRDRYLVAGYRSRGFRIFTLPDMPASGHTTPTLGLESTALRNRSNIRAMANYNNFLLLANDTGGLELYDVANTRLPHLADEFVFKNDGLLAQSCSVYRDTVYVPAWEAGLLVFRISKSPAPVQFNLENVDYAGSNRQ